MAQLDNYPSPIGLYWTLLGVCAATHLVKGVGRTSVSIGRRVFFFFFCSIGTFVPETKEAGTVRWEKTLRMKTVFAAISRWRSLPNKSYLPQIFKPQLTVATQLIRVVYLPWCFKAHKLKHFSLNLGLSSDFLELNWECAVLVCMFVNEHMHTFLNGIRYIA